METVTKRNDSPVSVTPALRRKLRTAFEQRFKSTEDFLTKWGQQSDTLGQPPTAAAVKTILYSVTRGTCVHWTIDGVCQLLLDRPYRDNSTKLVPPTLKQKLCDEFNERFKVGGEIAWGEFSVAWAEQLYDSDPPRQQTIRNFLADEYRSCEHWLVDGLCQLLLNCSFNEWLDRQQQSQEGEREGASGQNLTPSFCQSVFDDGATRWVGRQELIDQLRRRLLEDCRVLSIVGLTGIGKTALAMRLTLDSEIAVSFRELYIVTLERESSNFFEVARRLGQAVTVEHLQKDTDLLVKAMVNKLRSHPCLLILDMVEEVLEPDGKGGHQFIEPAFAKFLEQVVKADLNSRIILTSQDRLPVIAEGRYPMRSHQERLKGLEESEALELFLSWDVRIQTDEDLENLRRLIQIYEGHPLALRVIAGEIRVPPYNGDIQAYWDEYGDEVAEAERLRDVPPEKFRLDLPRHDRYSIDLADLVKERVDRTFSRLYRTAPLACLMLCQGAVYRGAVERQAWLLMVSEHPREAQALAFQTLQRRFLLEEEYTERRVFYRLHSLIRRVALDYLSKLEAEVLP